MGFRLVTSVFQSNTGCDLTEKAHGRAHCGYPATGLRGPRTKAPRRSGAQLGISLRFPSRSVELEDDLRPQLDDAGIVRIARTRDPAEVAGSEVSVRGTENRACTAGGGGELGVVPEVEEFEAQFELRFFPVERRDLMQGPIEVVDAGSVEEIPAGIAHGERGRRGEAGRIEVVVRSTAACARGAYVCEHTVTRIEDLDRSHGVGPRIKVPCTRRALPLFEFREGGFKT